MENTNKQLALLTNDIPRIKLAYLAGIIDGEGCINIHRRRDENFSYQLSITSIDVVLLEWVQGLVGGYIYGPSKGRNNKQYFYTWHANGLLGKRILEALMPYLITKKEPASMFIEAVTIAKGTTTQKRFAHIKEKINTLAESIQATHSKKGKRLSEAPSG